MNCKKKNKFFITSFSLLLLLFFSFVISFPSFHELSHIESSVENHQECNLEIDSDVCHQAMHHFKNDLKCEHKNHIKNDTHCELCSSLFYLTLFLQKQTSFKSTSYPNALKEITYQQDFFSFYLFNEALRGPPIVLSI